MKFSDLVENALWALFFLAALSLAVLIVGMVGAAMYSELDCEWRPETQRCEILHEREQSQERES